METPYLGSCLRCVTAFRWLTSIPGKLSERGSNAPAVVLNRTKTLGFNWSSGIARAGCLKRNPDSGHGETAMTCGSLQGSGDSACWPVEVDEEPGKQLQGICPGHAIDVPPAGARLN